MRRHGLGRMNDNRERLAAFCKITWISPNARDWNQIDHIIINGRYRGSLMDNRTMRGANANSDHHIVMEKVRLKLCSTKRKRKERTIFDNNKLLNPCVNDSRCWKRMTQMVSKRGGDDSRRSTMRVPTRCRARRGE